MLIAEFLGGCLYSEALRKFEVVEGINEAAL